MTNFHSASTRRAVASFAQEIFKPVVVLIFYSAVTALLLYPLSFQFADHVVDWGDPLENTWVLASGGRALIENPLIAYQANIFYPYANSLAFSESQTASALLALPIFFATDNPILAYNFVFLAAFILSAFNTYLLAYDLTKNCAGTPAITLPGEGWQRGRRVGGALLAGIAFAFWAYKFNHLSHINLVTLQWLPLVLLSLRRTLNQDRVVFPILFAITLTLQALSSWYAALMTFLVVGFYIVYVLIRRWGHQKWRRWMRLAVCFATALILIGILAVPYFQVSRELQFARSLDDARKLSARTLSFVSISPSNWLYQNLLPRAIGDALFPGALVLIFAAFGLRKKFRFADRVFWMFTVLLFLTLAFGPFFQLAPQIEFPSLLYQFLYDLVPGFQATRAPARFFVVGMLGLTLLAANGFASLTKNLSPRRYGLFAPVVLALLCVEYLAIPIRTIPIETGAQIPNVYRWLESQPGGNIIELPTRVGDVEPITRAMYFSVYHQRAMPLGYASFIPSTQNDFLQTLGTALETPSPRVPNMLREFNVRYVILNLEQEDADSYANAFAQLPSFEIAYQDATQRVYQINTNAPEHPLQLDCLAPAFAAPNALYLSYLVAQHTRRYPIVNDDLQTHTVTLTWRAADSTITQTRQVKLPYVLRDRAEGIPLVVNAPSASGNYDLSCALDNSPAPLSTQTVLVANEFRITQASPLLELLEVKRVTGAPQRGSEVVSAFFWRRRAEPDTGIVMQVRLVDENGNTISEIAREPVQYTYPVRLWRDNELVADSYALPIPSDGPSANYHLTVRALSKDTNGALAFRDPRGEITTEFASEPFSIR